MDLVGICNAALVAAGVDPIQSYDASESHTAEVCVIQLPLVRDVVLGDLHWRFATGRWKVAEDANPPTWGKAHRYLRPADTITVRDASDGTESLTDWALEGNYVVTDQASPIYLLTTDRVTDVGLWPPGFCSSVAARLAAFFALEFRESRTLHDAMMHLYEVELGRGGGADQSQAAPAFYLGKAVDAVRNMRR